MLVARKNDKLNRYLDESNIQGGGFKMKVRIIVLIMFLAICILPKDAFAMSFSGLTQIGSFSTKDGTHFTSKTGTVPDGGGAFDFSTTDDGKIRVYLIKGNNRIGQPNHIENTVSFKILGGQSIKQINSDHGMKIYILTSQATDGSCIIKVIGRNNDGHYTEYVTEQTFKNYNAADCQNYNVAVSGDTIIINGNYGFGETHAFLLKWDDAAKWFGIDYK